MRWRGCAYHVPVPEAPDTVEVEWQFEAASTAAAVEWLGKANVPGYTVRPKGTKGVRDTYCDTADWRLHRAGFTCRLRRVGGESADESRNELTLKAMASATEGLRTRREMTSPLSGEGTEALLAAPGPAGEALRLVAGVRPLEPLFSLAQVRQAFVLADGEGEIGEVTVDSTEVLSRGGETRHNLARVEVEVEAGAVDRAERFVGVLVAAAKLQPARVSKFEAAMALTGVRPKLLEGELGPVGVTAEMTAAEFAFAVMRKHFAVFFANEPGTRLGEDIEALHDMRVATRRLRAAMQAFRPFLSPRLERLRDELGWVAAALGAVRDLDVQLERMAEWRAEAGADAAALDAVEALFAARRVAARRKMLAALDSRRYDRLVTRFAAVLRYGPPRSHAPGRAPILAVAPDLLERRYRRLRKLGDPIRPASPAAAYHALRIEGKKLRYALEFVGPIYGERATEFARRVTALQDVLGLHQDAEVAGDSLREMAATAGRRLGPETLLAMGAIAERYRRHGEELRGEFPKVYRPLRGREWRALRKVIEERRVESERRAARGAEPAARRGA
jgi:CHAD domain-containing protein